MVLNVLCIVGSAQVKGHLMLVGHFELAERVMDDFAFPAGRRFFFDIESAAVVVAEAIAFAAAVGVCVELFLSV